MEEERASRKGVAWEGTQWDLKTFHEVTGWKRERKVRHMVVHDKTDDDYGGDEPCWPSPRLRAVHLLLAALPLFAHLAI